MAEILPRHYIIGIILFTLVIVSGVSILGLMNAKNPSLSSNNEITSFNKTFNKMGNVTTQIESMQSQIENADTDFGAFGVLNALINTGWQGLKLLFNSFSFMNVAFEGLGTFFGVPAFIPALGILIVAVVFIFSILSAIFQREI